jgi:hypothetical protein
MAPQALMTILADNQPIFEQGLNLPTNVDKFWNGKMYK